MKVATQLSDDLLVRENLNKEAQLFLIDLLNNDTLLEKYFLAKTPDDISKMIKEIGYNFETEAPFYILAHVMNCSSEVERELTDEELEQASGGLLLGALFGSATGACFFGAQGAVFGGGMAGALSGGLLAVPGAVAGGVVYGCLAGLVGATIGFVGSPL